jgi:hypothetical protein
MIINIALGLITVLLTALTWLTDIRGQDKSKRFYGILSIVLILIAAILSIIKDREASNKIEIANQTINSLNEQIIHLEQTANESDNLSKKIQGKWKSTANEQWDFLSDGTVIVDKIPNNYKLLDDGRLRIDFAFAFGLPLVFNVSFMEDNMILNSSDGKYRFQLSKLE